MAPLAAPRGRFGFGDDESGYSLIELLIALVLMGVVVVGVVGMLGTLVITSAQAQTQAQADSVARSAAEVVRAAKYESCSVTPAGQTYKSLLDDSSKFPRQGFDLTVTQVRYLAAQQTTSEQTPQAAVTEISCDKATAQEVSLSVRLPGDTSSRADAVVTKRRPCKLGVTC